MRPGKAARLLVWLTMASAGACSLQAPPSPESGDHPEISFAKELTIELEALRNVELSHALPLRVVGSFPDLGNEGGASLRLAGAPAYGPSQDIHAAEQERRQVVSFRPDLSGWRPFTPRLDDYPLNLEIQGGMVYVDVSGRIDSFGSSGERLFSFHTYYNLFDFTVLPDGSIWVNPRWTRARPDQPLLIHLDASGRKIAGLGQRSSQEAWRGLLDNVFLASGFGRLWALGQREPVLRVFDTGSGREIAARQIKHPLFREVRAAARWPLTGGQGRSLLAPRYTADLVLDGKELFVLLHLPFVEILRLDFEGREKARYRWQDDNLQLLDLNGLDVRGGARHEPVFLVLALRNPPFPQEPHHVLLELAPDSKSEEPLS
ncbi:MAG TPA: hypothetical protein VLU25_17505 [Acidobacteriota bacterium]|nr:hypothetical protein [Acidobacteriota bacterium]